jgi:hypothetical protein
LCGKQYLYPIIRSLTGIGTIHFRPPPFCFFILLNGINGVTFLPPLEKKIEVPETGFSYQIF